MKIGVACEYTFQNKPLRSIVHSNQLIELLQNNLPTASKITGSGTLESPYLPSSVGEWYALSQMKSGVLPMFILAGGRLIARWGSGSGKFVDYCTDVTGREKQVGSLKGEEGYEDYVHELGRYFKSQDVELGIDPSLPSYTRKALRIGDVDDTTLAIKSRLVLKGVQVGVCDDCPEIACTLCSLFISESSRLPIAFLASLILLDLVESRTTYGSGGGKTYTWKSMLMYHDGPDQPPIPGRGQGQKALGKHPMAGVNTVALAGRDLTSYVRGSENMVRDRLVSLASVWLAHYLAKNHKGYTFFILHSTGMVEDGQARNKSDKGNETLRSTCNKALRDRCSSIDLLIGGTIVGYQDLSGNTV